MGGESMMCYGNQLDNKDSHRSEIRKEFCEGNECYKECKKIGEIDISCYGYSDWLEDKVIELKKTDIELFKLRQFLMNGFENDYIKFERIDREDPAFKTFKMLFGDDEAEKIARDK